VQRLAPRLEDEGADEQAHLVGCPVAGVEVTAELLDEVPVAQQLVPDDVGSVPTTMDVLGMSVQQHDVVATRRQLPQQPEVVADHVTRLRAVDDDDVTGRPVAALLGETLDRPARIAVVDEETVRKLDGHEVGHFQRVVVSSQILVAHPSRHLLMFLDS